MIWSRKMQKTSMNFISAFCFTQAFHSHDISDAASGGVQNTFFTEHLWTTASDICQEFERK